MRCRQLEYHVFPLYFELGLDPTRMYFSHFSTHCGATQNERDKEHHKKSDLASRVHQGLSRRTNGQSKARLGLNRDVT
jgi:hypothetical protein